MSISSVPGTNSVFFASLPIDYLPIDKVWGKVRGFDTPVKSRGRKVSLLSNRMRPASQRISDTTPQFILSTSDKTVSLRAALEWRLRSANSESRIAGLASFLGPKILRLAARP
jgi:hypothetical protein